MRFAFGENWKSFSDNALDQSRLEQARADFQLLMSGIDLKQKSFLDIGFGQGLVLCLAQEAGANAEGIDLDPNCGDALASSQRFFSFKSTPKFSIGSILDNELVNSLRTQGGFDVVHSWGVLHHTGEMYAAIKNAASLVKENGKLIIAIYRRHWTCPIWTLIKKTYNLSPQILRRAMLTAIWMPYALRVIYLDKLHSTKNYRGMELYHNLRDWVGGYPYEYASKDEIVSFVEKLGFKLEKFIPTAGWTGCNEFVFSRK